MRTIHLSGIVLLFSLLLPACVPESMNPLSDPASATVDKRLLGVWIGKMAGEEEDQYVHFVEAENSITEIVLVSHQEKREAGVAFYKMHPTTIGKTRYMNVKPYAPEDFKNSELAEEIKSQGYIFARYAISGQGILNIWILMDKKVREAVKKQQLKGKIAKGEGAVTITDTSEHIIKFLNADHQDDIFELMFTFRKFEQDSIVD